MLIPSTWGNHSRGERENAPPPPVVPNDEFVAAAPESGKGKRVRNNGENKGNGKRRRAGNPVPTETPAVSATNTTQPPPPPPSADDAMRNAVFSSIRDSISKGVLSRVSSNRKPSDIDLDTVLSRIPYHKMLEDLFGGEQTLPDDVPVVTRAYEEQFMRECAHSSERQCVMGESCECMFIDTALPFIGTEFIVPGDIEHSTPQTCVLCSRKITQQLYYDMVCKGVTFRSHIQRYGNICEQAGEYARECMLICPPNQAVHCMPLPIVAHQRSRYSVRIFNGVKHLRQHRVFYSDFQ